jgi:dimethylhistidine N-methyltransferase
MDAPLTNIVVDADAPSVDQFAADVRYYLSQTPRQLPSRYFYDAIGSALFDTICLLPWYPITRAEMRLLAAHGNDILQRISAVTTIVELGPGSGEKLRTLLEAGASRLRLATIQLIDVSASALQVAARTLAPLGTPIVMQQATYDAGLRAATRHSRGRTLVAFLGSNIGNFDPPGAAALLHGVRAGLAVGDAVLLGADLVKPEARLLAAYDDPLGVTAAFNRNLLVRINRELDAAIDLDAFAHRAVWNAAQSRIEMHLVATRAQSIRIPRADLEVPFASGDSIWTESSYKYTAEALQRLLRGCGFTPAAQWIDREDAFALTLAEAVEI